MPGLLKKLWSDEEAVTTVEYALLLAVVAVVGLAAWKELGESVGATVGKAQAELVPSS